ncbi:serine/threonine-protein kinase [Sorangium sp. So ce1099]|uniref:serine/threonine-protein kinase n=1 Tax=Sorangium sp. So ce1099 TaxID=3133331 RepID=UPI003F5E0F07
MDSSGQGAVGPYELLFQLATGGMAEVFIARRACAAVPGAVGGPAEAGCSPAVAEAGVTAAGAQGVSSAAVEGVSAGVVEAGVTAAGAQGGSSAAVEAGVSSAAVEAGGSTRAVDVGGAAPEREPLVAVKRIRADLRYESGYAAMLFDEAGIASRVVSPNFVPVLDYGLDEGGAPYIVMELVVGVTLKHLTRPPEMLEIGDALDLIAQSAEGLHAAHEARDSSGELLQVIHRDISPSNILVGVDGRASICDLGLAYALRRTTRTKTGTVKGKLSYLSPEQAHARALDRRSDVFSLGVVAWEVLAGRRLFMGSSMLSILHAVLEREVPPLSSEREGVGQAVTAAVARALERDRDARWPTAAEFARALREAAEREGHAASRGRVGALVAEVLSEPLKLLAPSYAPGGPLATPESVAALRAMHASGVVGEADSSGLLVPRRTSRG